MRVISSFRLFIIIGLAFTIGLCTAACIGDFASGRNGWGILMLTCIAMDFAAFV